ncbi:MAG: hypothetical protein J6A30_07335 [Ruminococcus sp.]|nr:hypothetical protein [Ruminococcus sp.]
MPEKRHGERVNLSSKARKINPELCGCFLENKKKPSVKSGTHIEAL